MSAVNLRQDFGESLRNNVYDAIRMHNSIGFKQNKSHFQFFTLVINIFDMILCTLFIKHDIICTLEEMCDLKTVKLLNINEIEEFQWKSKR